MLKICYLSDNPIRIRNSKNILRRIEQKDVIFENGSRIRTKTAEYVFVNCRDAKNIDGLYADQAIIDCRELMINFAKMITAGSCVPDGYRIIDDRSIGTSDA